MHPPHGKQHCHPDVVGAMLRCCRYYSSMGLDINKLMEAGPALAGGRRSGRARKQGGADDGAVVVYHF
jgi:hypothetical protein